MNTENGWLHENAHFINQTSMVAEPAQRHMLKAVEN